MKTTKVTVTALKAPWPEGVKVGDVVAFKGTPPAWAQGKFTNAPEGEKADFDYEPAEVAGTLVVDGGLAARQLSDAMSAATAEVADLQAKLTAAGDALKKAQDEAKADKARADDLQAKLTAAEVAAQKAAKK